MIRAIHSSLALLILLSGLSSFAQGTAISLEGAQAPVSIDCNFRVTTKVSCNDFIRGFFSTYESVVQMENNLESSILSLKVTDEALAQQKVQYHFEWKSKDQTQVSDFVLPLILDQGMLDEVGMLNSLIRNAGKGLVLYLDVTEQETKDGQIVIVYRPKSDQNEPDQKEDWLDRLGKSPIFIGVDFSGSYRTSGRNAFQSTNLNASSSGNLIYTVPKFKVDLSGYYSYRRASIPSGNGSISGDSYVGGVNSILVYSMTRRWNVAVINSYNSDQVSNIEMSLNTGAGVEWTLVPFRTTENKELAFRVGGYHNTLRLGSENDLGNIHENYFSAFAKVFYFWTLNEGKTTIRLNAGIDQNLKYQGYQNYSFGSSFTFQLNRAVRLNLSGSYSYAPKSMTYPANPNLSNPVQVQLMKGQAGNNLGVSVGLNVTLGNSLRKTRDRRWAN